MPKRHPISQFLKDQRVYYEKLYTLPNQLSITKKWWGLSRLLDHDELFTIHDLIKSTCESEITISLKQVTHLNTKGYLDSHICLLINYQK